MGGYFSWLVGDSSVLAPTAAADGDEKTEEEWDDELREEFQLLCAEGNIKRTKGMMHAAEQKCAALKEEGEHVFRAEMLETLKRWGVDEALELARKNSAHPDARAVVALLEEKLEEYGQQ